MLSNLRFQLRKVGLEHKFPRALEKTIRVREEFGYPIMVTPLSQFVGSQAAINVIVGERYKEVTDQVNQVRPRPRRRRRRARHGAKR